MLQLGLRGLILKLDFYKFRHINSFKKYKWERVALNKAHLN